MPTPKLKPCPFCGGMAFHEGGAGQHCIRCSRCGIGNEWLPKERKPGDYWLSAYESAEEAAEAWNRRAPVMQAENREAHPPCLYSDGKGGCRVMPGVPATETPCAKPDKPWKCKCYMEGGRRG